MTRVLLGFAGAVTLLGAGACRRDDPTAKAIRATMSSANPPASLQNGVGPSRSLARLGRARDEESRW